MQSANPPVDGVGLVPGPVPEVGSAEHSVAVQGEHHRGEDQSSPGREVEELAPVVKLVLETHRSARGRICCYYKPCLLVWLSGQLAAMLIPAQKFEARQAARTAPWAEARWCNSGWQLSAISSPLLPGGITNMKL